MKEALPIDVKNNWYGWPGFAFVGKYATDNALDGCFVGLVEAASPDDVPEPIEIEDE